MNSLQSLLIESLEAFAKPFYAFWDFFVSPLYLRVCNMSMVKKAIAPQICDLEEPVVYSHRGTGLGPHAEIRRLHQSCKSSGRRVLAVGVERGDEILSLWPKYNPSQVVGIDVIPWPLEWQKVFAEANISGFNVDLLQMDATDLLFPDGHVDLICSSGVLEHIKDLERFFSEAQRVLKRGGRLYSYFGPLWYSFGVYTLGNSAMITF